MPGVLFQVVRCYIFDALQRVQPAQHGPNSSYSSCLMLFVPVTFRLFNTISFAFAREYIFIY